ncbi:hypothetical protein [Natrialba chahannaoensis]|uniref:hypothetical protein n=1 Tax=Natrialba chahannaoensis TaxID=68911 RepID=UPI000677A266|nr:hypothetical protein [Natrialba chahannaoensis]
MHDVIPTTIRSDRHLLAVSFACFGVAGAAGATADALGPTLGATALAIGGVYTVARYANRVSRRSLATNALAFWSGFLAISGTHLVGLGTIGAVAPGPDSVVALGLTVLTWATLLTACAATTFLGFREYGATVSADTPEEQVLEGDTSDYPTR